IRDFHVTGVQTCALPISRIEALELDNMIEVAVATLVSAEARKESRGAHDRADFPKRDDVNWLKHTLYLKEGHRLEYRPVHLKPQIGRASCRAGDSVQVVA